MDDYIQQSLRRIERESDELAKNVEQLRFDLSGLEIQVMDLEGEATFWRLGTLIAFIGAGIWLWNSPDGLIRFALGAVIGAVLWITLALLRSAWRSFRSRIK